MDVSRTAPARGEYGGHHTQTDIMWCWGGGTMAFHMQRTTSKRGDETRRNSFQIWLHVSTTPGQAPTAGAAVSAKVACNCIPTLSVFSVVESRQLNLLFGFHLFLICTQMETCAWCEVGACAEKCTVALYLFRSFVSHSQLPPHAHTLACTLRHSLWSFPSTNGTRHCLVIFPAMQRYVHVHLSFAIPLTECASVWWMHAIYITRTAPSNAIERSSYRSATAASISRCEWDGRWLKLACNIIIVFNRVSSTNYHPFPVTLFSFFTFKNAHFYFRFRCFRFFFYWAERTLCLEERNLFGRYVQLGSGYPEIHLSCIRRVSPLPCPHTPFR